MITRPQNSHSLSEGLHWASDTLITSHINLVRVDQYYDILPMSWSKAPTITSSPYPALSAWSAACKIEIFFSISRSSDCANAFYGAALSIWSEVLQKQSCLYPSIAWPDLLGVLQLGDGLADVAVLPPLLEQSE